jgi:hypothetical protein
MFGIYGNNLQQRSDRESAEGNGGSSFKPGAAVGLLSSTLFKDKLSPLIQKKD